MLAQYLVWHLRKAWIELTYTDEHPPTRDNPVAPAQRSTKAAVKASRHTNGHGQPVRSFRALLTHLSTLIRNDIRYGDEDLFPSCPPSPHLPRPSDAPSNYSTRRSRSNSRSQNPTLPRTTRTREIADQRHGTPSGRSLNFGLGGICPLRRR